MFKKKTNIITEKSRIDEVLTRGVDTIYPNDKWLRRELESGRRLRLYLGWDPTTTDIHIGHTVQLWKMREFQRLGHEVILLMGTFTATLGDPTGKAESRKPLTIEETKRNAKGFEEKTRAIFDYPENPITIKYNHEWLEQMNFADVVKLASNFTVQQMMERDMFQDRIKDGAPIGLHEFMYPLMQGYDSVSMDVDLEVGGTDQTFNMLVGRTLMKKTKGKEKGVLTRPLIADASGRKIGKSEGNAINIDSLPEDLYGKIMTLPDEVIWMTFEMTTDLSVEKLAEVKNELESDPRAAKGRLAWEIVRIYNDSTAADAAQESFVNVFKNKEAPKDMPKHKLVLGTSIVDVLVETKVCSSKSEARRAIEQGGVKMNDEKVTDIKTNAALGVLQKGKRHFIKLV
ncbi:tyrosine--tRNA ligase [Candidatus Uhrbacteria bacterium]|jgi:tyrosyl-tRNA synthetase|nr:tyrosine--tRNA ligase [Candidatus Uhrbacteria bacterium]